MGGCSPVGLLRCVISLSLLLLPLMDTFLNFGSIVVCRWDGFAVCAVTARVATRCFGCPVAHKVRFCRGLSQERVIMITPYASATG